MALPLGTQSKYAVVSGGNKGIGLETVKQLASEGVKVVLTARDEKKGLEALETLRESGVSSDLVCFHQLDVQILQVWLLLLPSSNPTSANLIFW